MQRSPHYSTAPPGEPSRDALVSNLVYQGVAIAVLLLLLCGIVLF
ncbi:MAG: hypothetical protein ACRD3N_13185 [Terracidiphilus sp.]